MYDTIAQIQEKCGASQNSKKEFPAGSPSVSVGAIHAVRCVKTELLLFSIHSLVIRFPNFFANYCSY